MKLTFLLFVIPFLGLIAAVSVAIFKAGIAFGILRSPISREIVRWIFILMPIVLMVTMVVGNVVYSNINNFFYSIAATWLPILIYFFMGAVLLSILSLTGMNMFPFAIGVIVISLGATAFGIINATMPRVVTYEVDSPALSEKWSGKNIVLISDTHLGVVRSGNFMKKVVKKINEQKPDLVLIAGDVIDGPIFNYEKGLAPLKDIVSTFGTVYTPGNHEAYNSEPEKFYPIIRGLTTTLVDSKVEINGTTIVGLDYASESVQATQDRLAKTGFIVHKNNESENMLSGNVPSIALLHDPRNTDALLDAGVSLVVSGHTHCGQFFPMTLVVKSIYKKHTYGLVDRTANNESAVHESKSGVSITTCGVGTAMSPLRLGTNPEVVVIHIK